MDEEILYMYTGEELKRDELRNEINYDDIYDMIDTNIKGKRVSVLQREQLKKALKKDIEPEDEKLADIYYDIKEKLKTKYESGIKLYDEGKFCPMPDINKERCIWFLAGASGSGKSYLASKILEQYKAIYQKNKIFVFSGVDYDEVYDKQFDIVRIPMDEDLINDPIQPEQLSDSICVFDDIDTLGHKEISMEVKHENKKGEVTTRQKIKKIDLSEEVRKLRDKILEKGRHLNISAICMSHHLNNYGKTRNMTLEANYVVVFKGTGAYHVKQWLSKHAGFEKDTIQRVLDVPSRWTLLSVKTYPQYVLTENECFLLR